MADFGISEMMDMQRQLAEHYQNPSETPAPDKLRKKTLWMLGEVGEVIDIEKKRGEDAILNDADTRAHFVEEMADVLMYYNEILMCAGVTPEELKASYVRKFTRNMTRWDKK